MSILDFFTREAGQERRRALEGLLTQFIPPEMRPQLGLLAEANPVVSMERAGQDAQQLFAPDQSLMDRLAAGGRMASNMAGVVAPAVVAGRAGVPAAQALEEAFTGLSMSPGAAALRDFGADEFGGVGLPGRTDPALQRAEEVMARIRAGRADEVTDSMFDLGSESLNLDFQRYLDEIYDLPLDEDSKASRMWDMGLGPELNFGDPYYHGTDANPYMVDLGFDLSRVGSKRENFGGIHAVSNASTASEYGSNQIPLVVPRNLARLDFENPDHAKMLADFIGEFDGSTGDQLAEEIGRSYAAPVHDLAANYLHSWAKGKGAEGIGLFDGHGEEQVVVFNPARLRYPTARFDPRLAHLKNLNAALAAGLPIGLLSMRPEEEQY
jgi:hypothetical protein